MKRTSIAIATAAMISFAGSAFGKGPTVTPSPDAAQTVTQRSSIIAEQPSSTTVSEKPTTQSAMQEGPQSHVSKGNRITAALAVYVVAQFFMWIICDREHIEWCQAPDWYRGPLDDRFDLQRYGVQ